MQIVRVVDYDPAWLAQFEALRSRLWPAVKEVALAIEHVGSTSVVGLAAKPIIDMDIVVPSQASVAGAIERLAALGYRHRGDLGISGREAFEAPAGLVEHHLYVCCQGSVPLENHLAVRDYLRSHPEAIQAYGDLKKKLAQQFPHDIDRYMAGKTDFIVAILRGGEFSAAQIEEIEEINRGDFEKNSLD